MNGSVHIHDYMMVHCVGELFYDDAGWGGLVVHANEIMIISQSLKQYCVCTERTE